MPFEPAPEALGWLDRTHLLVEAGMRQSHGPAP
jgi:hypothetical protein